MQKKVYFKKYFYKDKDNYDILKKKLIKKNIYSFEEKKTFKMHANHTKKRIAHVNFI